MRARGALVVIVSLVAASCTKPTKPPETVPLENDAPPAGTADVPAPAKGPGDVTVDQLLSEERIRAITRFAGTLSHSVGASAPDANGATGFEWSAMDNDSWATVGVFLWKASTDDELAKKLAIAATDFSDVKRTGPDTFVAREQGIQAIGFADRSRRLVVLLTCGVDQCTKPEMTVELTRAIQRRIVELWP